MGEAFTIVFVFFGVIVITAVVFAVWLVLTLARMIGRGIASILRFPMRPPVMPGPTMHCPRPGCQAVNPTSARFCRRCGQELLKGPAARRQAAVW